MDRRQVSPKRARLFVLAEAIVCFAFAVFLYAAAGPTYLLVGSGFLGIMGAIHLSLFLFASTETCQRVWDLF